MTILCDTREKKNGHILKYFEEAGIDFRVQKLDTGDYMSLGNDDLTIDRKKDLQELVGNLFTSDKTRFWREVRRAKAERKQMIVLCEHGGEITCLNDVPKWKSRYSKITGRQLYTEICRVSIAYGVEFFFCGKKETGAKIVELLGGKTDQK